MSCPYAKNTTELSAASNQIKHSILQKEKKTQTFFEVRKSNIQIQISNDPFTIVEILAIKVTLRSTYFGISWKTQSSPKYGTYCI